MPKIMDEIILTGGEPSVSTTPNVLLRGPDDKRLLVLGVSSAVPSAKSGYAVGCTFVCTDTGQTFYNVGSTSSCNFLGGPILKDTVTGLIYGHEMVNGVLTKIEVN